MVKLVPELIRAIEEILNGGKTVEIAVRNGKIVVWANSSKKKYEQPIALGGRDSHYGLSTWGNPCR